MTDNGGGMPEIARSAGGVRVERVVTSGTFELDGGSWEVDNNVWIVGDDKECVIIDPAHDARRIVKSIPRERKVVAVLLTHAHNDHINGVGEVCDATRAPAYLHPEDRVLWDQLYPVTPDRELRDGDVIRVGDVDLHVLHTPGHSPGACSFYAPALDVVFTRRHPVQRWARRDGAVVQRLPDDHRVDPREAADAARRDGRPDRPR